MKYAVQKTKLSDFGGEGFKELYDSIMSSPRYLEQCYSNLGYISGSIEINMGMVRRLRTVEYFKRVPAVLKVPVPGPVFVMGLPRTGTTFLHRLLSLDPRVRAPLTWELLAPCPAEATISAEDSTIAHTADREKRRKYVANLLKTRSSMGDNALKHIHEVGTDLPEECLLAMSDEMPIHLQVSLLSSFQFG
jgi:hypothetical protein